MEMPDSRSSPRKNRVQETIVDPETGKTITVEWTVEEDTEHPAAIHISATGIVALWKRLTYGAGMLSFRVIVVGLVLTWIFGWLTAPFYALPWANGFGLGLIWLVSSIGFVRFWRLIHQLDFESDDDRRFFNWNIVGFILCLFIVGYLQSVLISLGIPRHG